MIGPIADTSLMFPNLEETEEPVNQSCTEHRHGASTFLRGRDLNLRHPMTPFPLNLGERFPSSAAFSFVLLSLLTLSHELTGCHLVAELQVRKREVLLKDI